MTYYRVLMPNTGGKFQVQDPSLMLKGSFYPLSLPWDILDALETYFERLLGIVQKENHVPENEDLDVLQIFSPLMRQIFLSKPYLWKNVSMWRSRWCDFPEELQEKRCAVRRTFNSFAREVDKVFCHMHVRTPLLSSDYLAIYILYFLQSNQDPELSWCQHRGQCIADLYSLP